MQPLLLRRGKGGTRLLHVLGRIGALAGRAGEAALPGFPGGPRVVPAQGLARRVLLPGLRLRHGALPAQAGDLGVGGVCARLEGLAALRPFRLLLRALVRLAPGVGGGQLRDLGALLGERALHGLERAVPAAGQGVGEGLPLPAQAGLLRPGLRGIALERPDGAGGLVDAGGQAVQLLGERRALPLLDALEVLDAVRAAGRREGAQLRVLREDLLLGDGAGHLRQDPPPLLPGENSAEELRARQRLEGLLRAEALHIRLVVRHPDREPVHLEGGRVAGHLGLGSAAPALPLLAVGAAQRRGPAILQLQRRADARLHAAGQGLAVRPQGLYGEVRAAGGVLAQHEPGEGVRERGLAGRIRAVDRGRLPAQIQPEAGNALEVLDLHPQQLHASCTSSLFACSAMTK